ncbi:hypothetical protein B0H10DRAFT_1947521 [Mycena sp. CBHHK59/15]|nr:hypothetical protein B0H10DRAFT_1947521 [Mycena sp. CBHHK59/15]
MTTSVNSNSTSLPFADDPLRTGVATWNPARFAGFLALALGLLACGSGRSYGFNDLLAPLALPDPGKYDEDGDPVIMWRHPYIIKKQSLQQLWRAYGLSCQPSDTATTLCRRLVAFSNDRARWPTRSQARPFGPSQDSALQDTEVADHSVHGTSEMAVNLDVFPNADANADNDTDGTSTESLSDSDGSNTMTFPPIPGPPNPSPAGSFINVNPSPGSLSTSEDVGDVVSGTAAELYRTATRDGADVAESKDGCAALRSVTVTTLPLMRPMGQSALPQRATFFFPLPELPPYVYDPGYSCAVRHSYGRGRSANSRSTWTTRRAHHPYAYGHENSPATTSAESINTDGTFGH